MSEFTVFRTISPFNRNKKYPSASRRLLGISTADSSRVSQIPQNLDSPLITVYPHKVKKLLGRSKPRTGLTPRIERKIIKSTTNTPDVESLWPRNSIPSKDNKSHANLLKHGMQINKIKYATNISFIDEKVTGLSSAGEDGGKDERKKEGNSIDGIETFKSKSEIPSKSNYLIIKKSKIAAYEAYNLRKPKTNGAPFVSQTKTPAKQVEVRKSTLTPQPRKPVFKKIEKISVKETMRDKEWLGKAKGQILKDFALQLNWSNGMTLVTPTENYFTYKYYLGKGNNSALVKQCLSTRYWWSRVEEADIDSANLIWTQWKDRDFLKKLPILPPEIEHQLEATPPITISTNVRYLDPASSTSSQQIKIVDLTPLGFDAITKAASYSHLSCSQTYNCNEIKMHNKLERNYHLSNKKALFINLKQYYTAIGENVFNYTPITYHIKDGEEDPTFAEFEQAFNEISQREDQGKKPLNVWIVKPGENTNRGTGINVCASIDQVKQELKNNPCPRTGKHTFIVQKYIERPFLINKRKFDIRCYALITCYNGVVQGYFYNEGYLRTASKGFSISNITNKYIHLTNDAVQKNSEDYGKYENGNKMTYSDFQRYLDKNCNDKKRNFNEEVLPVIRTMVKDTIQAVYLKLDPNHRIHTFEIFGYDFLLDEDLKPWLLEVNTNPCLELSSTHLGRIIPSMLENAFRIALDSIFQEPNSTQKRTATGLVSEIIPENRFELIFHSCVDGPVLLDLLKEKGAIELFQYSDPIIEEMSDEEDEQHDEPEEVKADT
ncbi:unnamed protein product [Blepharisma stoltei]|uniref:Tubulin-tyrosine ligase family protein n=1 Tax=Blepharisma stoltei TaxID=1481888 RepID=A0AAU9IPG6_9CILI|nr:unnamed protein product [Blepharisma stoltei]